MRKFRILRVSHLAYPQALTALLYKYPDIQKKPYLEQSELLFNEKLVYSNSFSRAMRQLGHIADEVVYDIDWLQKTWAKEHSVSYSQSTWEQEILLAQIEAMRPEILYFQHSPPLPYEIWKDLKNRYPFIKKIVVHRGFPGSFDTLGSVDLLMVGNRYLVTQYANQDIQARLLYHYFDEAVLDVVRPLQAIYPVTFLGSSGYGYGTHHATRYWLLKELLEHIPIEMWLDEGLLLETDERSSSQLNVLQQSKRLVATSILKFLPWLPSPVLDTIANSKLIPVKFRNLVSAYFNQYELRSKLGIHLKEPQDRLLDLFPKSCHPPVFGLDYYQVLSRSQISFNCHTDAALENIGNIRMFQATGMGSCLLTDTGNNMSDLFEVDREVVTYSSREEALEKINFLLNNKATCQDIARAGHERTMRDHTALKRCQQIDEWLQDMVV
jgi:spore maturation protein CgeB